MTEYNERILKNVLQDYREENDEKLLKEIEEAKNNPLFQNKEGEAEAFALKYTAKPKKHSGKVFLRVASILLVFAIVVAVIPMPVDGKKSTLAEIIVNFVSSEFFSVGSNETDSRFLDYEGDYIPSYIPEGYTLKEITNGTYSKTIVFSDGKNSLVFSENTLNSNINIDYTDKENVQEFEVLGCNGVCFESEEMKYIYLVSDERMISISCTDISIDLIGFAKLIEKR